MIKHARQKKSARNRLGILVIFWAVLCFNPPAMALYEFYVDQVNGVAGNGGTSPADAFPTLLDALTTINAMTTELATDSAVIYVAKGTYSVALETDIAHTIGVPNITIKGAGNDTTIVDGSGGANWSNGIEILDSTANITITGLQFYGFSAAGVRINPSGNVKILDCYFNANGNGIAMENALVGGSAPVIMANSISGSFSYGIDVFNSSGYVLAPVIKGNTLIGISYNGINLSCMSGTVAGEITENQIIDCGNNGIYMYGDMGNITPVISSNTIESCPTGISVSTYNGVSAPVIRNNLITNTAAGGYGIYMSEGMSGGVNPVVYFNTIDGGGLSTTGIYISGFSTYINPVIRYNCVTNFVTSGIEQYAGLSATLDVDYNNAYGSPANLSANLAVNNNIEVDPLYAADFSIPDTSPCADALDPAVVVAGAADEDIIGTSRPRASSSSVPVNYDIGCYEYPYQEYTFTMPAGTGIVTDYRLMTFPMTLAAAQSFSTVFQSAFGAYNNEIYRVFLYNSQSDPATYTEMGEVNFDEMFTNWQGRAFWVISKSTSLPVQTHTFPGELISNRRPFYLFLSQGWNLIGLPWPLSTANPDSINLGHIVVDDGTGKYVLTDAGNTVTQPGLWDYTETGYVQLASGTDVMTPGKGYWLYVVSADAKVLIPPDNAGTYFNVKRTAWTGVRGKSQDVMNLTPPSPPGQYLRAEGEKGCFIETVFSEL